MEINAKRVFQIIEEFYSLFSNYENGWQNFLDNDFRYTSPLQNEINKQEFVKITRALQSSILDFQIIRKLASASSASFEVSYRICSNTPEEIIVVLKCVEFFEVRNEKIMSINSYFDPIELIKKLSEYKINLK